MKPFLFLFFMFLSQGCLAQNLVVQTKSQTHIFKTDIADTPEKQEFGLMFKKSIPHDYGMTFLFEKEEMIYMWMKNTFIPLDMVFFNNKGVIVHILTDVPAESLEIRSSKFPALGVIEFNAGTVLQKQISVGDKVYIQ